ncbi:hypothetical protein M3Y97_00619500 [Aphelenchoides bicaudatus]|nr:hypothetical protein M3Y97_00619500 [Aphelenchoides bicaudatus]
MELDPSMVINRESPSSSENGSYVAYTQLCYWPSVASVFSFGFLNLLFAKLDILGSALVLMNVVIFTEWLKLHSRKLTKHAFFCFDEKNILATSENFNFYLPPLDSDITPGGCCGAYPKSSNGILKTLFKDEQQEEMQKFYQNHYGGVYETAKKRQNEDSASQEHTDSVNSKKRVE